MTVYLGNSGHIELLRTSDGQVIKAAVSPADVTPSIFGFSFKDLDDNSAILTGDLIKIRSMDGRNLEWIDASAWDDGQQHPDANLFVNINQAGLIRLFREFEDAINYEMSGRVPLTTFAGAPIPITVEVVNVRTRCLGRVTGYEFNSERNAVDVSQLGEEFRESYGLAISGNGQLSALFDYSLDTCGDDDSDLEIPIYLHQLILRQQLGSTFLAKLFVISRGSGKEIPHELWYEFKAVVTNCALTVTTEDLIRSTINFVSTGPIHLRARFNSNYLLQEDDSLIELERLQDGALELEQQE